MDLNLSTDMKVRLLTALLEKAPDMVMELVTDVAIEKVSEIIKKYPSNVQLKIRDACTKILNATNPSNEIISANGQ